MNNWATITRILTKKLLTHDIFGLFCLVLFLDRKHYYEIFANNNVFIFQKERMESMETMNQNMSILIKSDKNNSELSFWRRLKLRFSSRLQRKRERETMCWFVKRSFCKSWWDFVICCSNEKQNIIYNLILCSLLSTPH